MGNNVFAPFSSTNSSFVVKNISSQNKTIKIFNYPINMGANRDLLKIPGIGEEEIRASLLKGELKHKILAKDIEILSSDIEILQFNSDQRNFLRTNGITNGTVISYQTMDTLYYQDDVLIGAIDGFNTVFTTRHKPFLQVDDIYKIIVLWNGIRQVLNEDYFISESGGPGTGFDTIMVVIAPSDQDIMSANYYVEQYNP